MDYSRTILWGVVHSANLDFASLISDEFEWKTVERSSIPSKMSKLLNLSLHSFTSSAQDDQPITKLSNTVKARKKESAKDKIIDEPEEKRMSLVKSRRGKGFMCYGDQAVNVPKKDVVPSKTRSLTIAEETVESDSETNDVDDSDMDLSDNSSQGDDDATGFGVFMHSKSITTPNSTYISPMVTSSSLDFIHNLLNETLANELTNFLSNPVYTNPRTTSVNIDPKVEVSYLGPLIVAIAKKLKEIIQKDELTIADLKEAKWNSDEDDVSKPRTFERHLSKNKKSHPSFYNNDYYYLVSLSIEEKYTTYITKHYAARYYKQGIEYMISDSWCKENHRYTFESLNGIHHWEDSKINLFKAEMINLSEGKIYSVLRIKSVVRIVVKKKWGDGFLTSIVVRRSDDNEYEFSYADLPRLSLNDEEDMYLLQVHDKLHNLPLEFVKDFNNALLLFIISVVIQNKVKDIQLGVESYQQTLNLTKPMMLFEGINQKIPFTMCETYKGVIHHNLIDMVNTNELGKGNRRLKGIDWADKDVQKSNEMVDKIDKTLKRKEKLRWLEEYVGGRHKTVNTSTFVRPIWKVRRTKYFVRRTYGVNAEFDYVFISMTLWISAGTIGLQISQSRRGIFINQSKYALEMLKKYGLDQCDPVDILMVERLRLDEDPNETLVDPTHYRAFANADYVVCQDSRKTTSGIAQFLGEKLIAYQLADIFTIALAQERFEFLVKRVGMQSITHEELKHLVEPDEDE
ncbi:hypothetical protein Tco_1090055 [Tanacetum coccineum]|uniref:Reverse transcriptase Ty1/copia-type domain-containing protein n=1 Tax=Tanacetum coccineum TaxID=301880 RepID=A0ABQ5I588_9ASTR